MASSTLSLDSLSSPSPSPSPPPNKDRQHTPTQPSTTATAASFRTLDTDSELSELTDDDQDPSAAGDKRAPSAATTHSSSNPPRDDDANPPTRTGSSSSRPTRRGKHPRSRGPGRKKRSSIVPAPMWGWAETKPPINTPAVEEEEEEMTGPPRAMEEEEEEEEDDEEEYDDDEEEEEGARGFVYPRRSGPYLTQRLPVTSPVLNAGKIRENGVKLRARKRGAELVEDGESKSEKRSRQSASAKRTQHEDDPPVVNGDDEDDEDSAYGSPYLSTKKRKPVKARGPAPFAKKRKSSGEDESSGSDHPPSKTKKNLTTKTQRQPQEDAGSDASNDPETESEDEPTKISSPVPKPISPTSAPPSANSAAVALSALAAIAGSVDTTDALPDAASASLIPPAASTSASTNGAGSRSRSHSLDPEASEEEEPFPKSPKSFTRARGGRGRGGGRGGRAKFRRRGGTARDRNEAPLLSVNGTTALEARSTKKAPPPPLELKIDTSVAQAILIEDMDVDVAEDDVNDRSMEEPEADAEPEDPGEAEAEAEEEEEEEGEEEEEEDPDEGADERSVGDEEEEQEAVDPDGEEEGIEAEDEAADNEGDEDQDQENDAEGAEEEQECDDEDPSPDGDQESDLQPADRREALEVLAMIELKFALLRERVYLEKMEGLAWEERMVQASTHPELQHLQKELSKRRDKRLELASRKRSFEVASATTRRKADESGVWSWWKHATNELQTEMIAETSRKRRRLERDRRAVERPQPIRVIPRPLPIDIHNAILPPPSIRKIIKSYPFGSRKQNKSDTYHHHHSHPYPKHLVYPEISTLSSMEISSELDYLYQHQRRPPVYDMQHQSPPHAQSQHYSQQGRNGPGLQPIGRSLSMGLNGSLAPSQTPLPSTSSPMGPPPLHVYPQHGMGYDQYGDLPPSSYGPGPLQPANLGRMREPSSSYATQGPGGGALALGPPPPLPSSATSRENLSYSSFPGHGGRSQPSSQHGPYPSDHEMSNIGPGGPGGGGHQLMPQHPYFSSQASSGMGNLPVPSSSSSAAHLHGNSVKGGPTNGKRSISPPVPVISNGAGGGGAKPNGTGSWMGMGMGGFHLDRAPSGSGKDVRMMHEEEERDRMMRERDQRKREDREREREQERERDMDFDRDRARRERDDLDRERQREHHHMLQIAQQQRPPPGSTASGVSHLHGGPSPSGMVPHHHVSHHHHRTHHHHHVVHHHHGQAPQHSSSSLPPPTGANPIMHSPRSTREYEISRPPPGSFHSGPGQSHTEVINLSSSAKPPQSSLLPREREGGHWPTKNSEEGLHHPSVIDYRDRERDAMHRDRNERDVRKLHSHRPSSGPPMIPLEDRGDRPMATPFVMASSHTMQNSAAGISSSTHINGSSSTSSPRGAPSWNTPGNPMDDSSYRMSSSSSVPPPPPGYMGSSHDRSPVQGHRYPPSSSSHPPLPMGRMSNSGPSYRMASPPLLPPSRARPPPSPSYSNSMPKAHRSPVTSPKIRPLSPVPSKHLIPGPPPLGPGYSPSPRLSGPGRTSTPTGHGHHATPLSSAGLGLGQQPPLPEAVLKNGIGIGIGISDHTASPLMTSLHAPPPGRSTTMSLNGSGLIGGPDRDRMERERHTSPRPGTLAASSSSVSNLPPVPPKLSTAQMVDGH